MRNIQVPIPANNQIPLRVPQGCEWKILSFVGQANGMGGNSQVEAVLTNGAGQTLWAACASPIGTGTTRRVTFGIGLPESAPVATNQNVASGDITYIDQASITAALPEQWIQGAAMLLTVSVSIGGTVTLQGLMVCERTLDSKARD